MKKRYVLLLLASFLLLFATIYGEFHPNDYRNKLMEPVSSFDNTVSEIDSLYQIYGTTENFYRYSVKTYTKGIIYDWPKAYCKIPFRTNYFLYLLSYVDALLVKLGLTDIDNLFSVFQSTDYRTALGRGFGICSQNALGYSDLLYQRYEIPSYILGLSGHVLVYANLDNGDQIILDPSLAIYIPHSVKYMEEHPDYATELYEQTGYPELALTFDKDGNILYNEVAGLGYNSNMYYLERITRTATYILPILMILAVSFFVFFKKN